MQLKIFRLQFIFLFLVLMGAVSEAGNIRTPFTPPSGETLLFIGQDRDSIADYVKTTGNVPGGTMVYTRVQKVDGLEGPVDYGGGPMDGDVLLKSYSDSVIQVGLYMVDGLDDTISGKYDDNLRKLALWIKQANRPVYLRIGYEFDNPENHYDPQQYKQAFRYIVDYLRKEKVSNVAYIWHSETSKYSGQHWMDWYPGDNYVDWFGASIFETSQYIIVSDFFEDGRNHGKPFMVCESSAWYMNTIPGKINWFNHIFQFIKDQNVEAFCYIDSNWNDMPAWRNFKFGDARLEENVEIKNLWLKEIDQDRYLKASKDLFKSLKQQ